MRKDTRVSRWQASNVYCLCNVRRRQSFVARSVERRVVCTCTCACATAATAKSQRHKIHLWSMFLKQLVPNKNFKLNLTLKMALSMMKSVAMPVQMRKASQPRAGGQSTLLERNSIVAAQAFLLSPLSHVPNCAITYSCSAISRCRPALCSYTSSWQVSLIIVGELWLCQCSVWVYEQIEVCYLLTQF